MMARSLTAIVLLAVATTTLAIDTELAFQDPELQARYRALTKELRCLQCMNQPIADSNAFLANDLRRQVKDMIEAGATNDEIKDYMVSRYGDFVLYKPRLNARSFLLWSAPVIFMLLGIVIVVIVVVRKASLPFDEDADADDTEANA